MERASFESRWCSMGLLTRAECESGDLVHAERSDGGRDAKVGGPVAQLLNIAERSGDLLVVGVELPELHDLAVDAGVLRSRHWQTSSSSCFPIIN